MAVFSTERRRNEWIGSDDGIARLPLTDAQAKQLVGDRLTKRSLYTTEDGVKWAASEYGDYVTAHIVALGKHPTVTEVLSDGMTCDDVQRLTVFDDDLLSFFFREGGDTM